MPATTDDDLGIVDDPDGQRYVARLGDKLAGFIDYRLVRGRLIFLHTEVDPAFEGRGIGGRLAASALNDVRTRGLTFSVKCPFIATYLQRHPEYEDLRAGRG
jgi:predicted GNAT family acetyltransferase